MVRAMRMSSERTVAEMGVSSSGASLRRRQAHLAAPPNEQSAKQSPLAERRLAERLLHKPSLACTGLTHCV